jgi:hypothetical protein
VVLQERRGEMARRDERRRQGLPQGACQPAQSLAAACRGASWVEMAQVEAHREPAVSPPPEPLDAQPRAERLLAEPQVLQESLPGTQAQSWQRPVVPEAPEPLRALPSVRQLLPEPARPREA